MMLTNFNGGEVSPFLRCRCDIDKYRSAAQTMENWEILPHGAIRKRSGSAKICDVTGRARLIPWEFGIGDGYMLIFTNYKITIYQGTSKIGDIESVWSEEELRMIKYIQSADVLFLVHPDHPVMTLTRTTSTTWTLTQCTFPSGPFMGGNESDTTVNLAGYFKVTGVIFYGGGFVRYPDLDQGTSYAWADGTETGATIGYTDTTTIDTAYWSTKVYSDWQRTTEVGTFSEKLTSGAYRVSRAVSAGNFVRNSSGDSGTSYAWSDDSNPVKTVYTDTQSLDMGSWRTKVYSDAARTTQVGVFSGMRKDAEGYDMVILQASSAIFKVTCGDQLMRITHPNTNSAIEHTFDADGVSDSVSVKGKWTLSTCGGWQGTLRLQRSFDGGTTWKEYRIWTSSNSSNVESSGTETMNGVLYRMTMSGFVPSTETTIYKCYATFCVEKYWIDGVVWLDRTPAVGGVVTASTTATGVIFDPIHSTEVTDDWAWGAWSGDKGYPRAVCFHGDRLCFAGTASQPQTVWMSAVGDYYNFGQSTDDDSAVDMTLRNDRVNVVEWMFPQGNKILVGTLSMEGFIYPSDDGVITPSNAAFEKKTAYGCASIAPMMVQDSLVFVQRGGTKLRCFQYDLNRDGYEAADISELAEHVMRDGVVEAAYKGLEYPALYFVRSDGEMAVLTFDRMQNVFGWGRWTTPGGQYESVSVLETDSGDELWVCVKRGTQHQIERFSSSLLQDCGSDYTAYYKSMPLESVQVDSFGHKKKLSRIGIKFYQSRGGEIRAGSGEWETVDQRKSSMKDNEAVPLSDWEYETVPAGGWTEEETVEVRQTGNNPLVLLAMYAKS